MKHLRLCLLSCAASSYAWVAPSTSTRHCTSQQPTLSERHANRRTSLGMVSSINKKRSSPIKDDALKSVESMGLGSSNSLSASDYAPRQRQGGALDSSAVSTSITEFWMPVISAALLITGNTFGASSIVLPQLVQQPGLAVSSGVFVAAYVMNLLSSLIIAEVAIQQKENSGAEVPSSFKELADENLKSPTLAILISVVSFCVNALVFSFDMSRVGIVVNQLSAGLVDASTMSVLWGAGLVALLSTQLAHTDPVAAWTNPGLAAEPLSALGDLAPVILMAMIYQNIIPTVTRLHDYDRTKTVTSMVIGSLIPLAMYMGWCFACLGGGIDLGQVGLESGPLLAVFSLATLAGSSIGCGLSCASELENFMGKDESSNMGDTPKDKSGFQLPSALVTVALPLSLTLAVSTFGNGDLTPALSVAGGIGSPLLYGVLPVMMAWKQRQGKESTTTDTNTNNMVPTSSLGVVGVMATGMLGTELVEQVGHLAHAM